MMKAAHGRILVLTGGILLASAGAYGHEAEGMFAKLLSLQVSEDISASGLGAGNNRIRKFSIPGTATVSQRTERCVQVLWHGEVIWM